MKVESYFTKEVISILAAAIEEAQGNEVFFAGNINEDGLVTEVQVGSRGNENEVPVNFDLLSNCSVLIHNHPGGNLKPSGADLAVAENSAANAKGFYIINNEVSDIYVVVEAVRPKKVNKLEIEKSANYISDGGSLSKLSENFEQRPGQIELLKSIASAFNENKIGIFEAGTGVGKSYAYLIPAALWAISNNEKVVISTGTINLQQQICEKDLPAVEKILNQNINFILMKGRQNYVCLRRLSDAASVLDLFEEESDELKQISAWAHTSDTGDKSELTFMPSENVWSKVNSESDACMGMKCPFHTECFVMKVRKASTAANIIVVNHHLLFADIEARMNGSGYQDAAVLPPYRHIVFDEAHGIENAATSFFSSSITRFKINKLINQMYRQRKKTETGLLCSLAILSANEEKASVAYDLTNKIKNDIINFEIAAKDLLQNDYTKRLCDESARDFGPFLVTVNNLAQDLGTFADLIRIVMEGIDNDDKDVPFFWESKIVLRRMDDYVLLLKDFCQWDEKRDYVFWIQQKKLSPELAREGDENFVILNQTPLDISSLMNQGVFEPMQSVICTSATLKTGRDFKYWAGRNGIHYVERSRVMCREFMSPFSYRDNMLFAVPLDAPLPEKMEYQQWVEMALPKLISAAQGRTLVLFTSYESLKSAFRTVSASMRGFKGRLMKQGDDENSRLLEYFKNEKESVLFATDSFWQGVDVPGESLSQVIIVKLPFTVPNDPVYVARAEAIEKKGGNSFMELSVPEAVIKYRQGIGRLIRSTQDKGVVVVLDRRIYEKRYGSIFISSMNECQKLYENLDVLTEKIHNFIFNRE